MLASNEVKHIARLGRLGLKDAEIKKFSTQLTDILRYVEILNEVDTKNVEPTSQVTGLENVTRKDEAVVLAKGEELLNCSPLEKQFNQIKVKPVIVGPEPRQDEA